MEGFRIHFWCELLASETVIVAQVLVKSSGICLKGFHIITPDCFIIYYFFFKLDKVFVLEEGMKHHKQRRSFIANLMRYHLCTSPGCFRHVVSIVLFLLRELCICFTCILSGDK